MTKSAAMLLLLTAITPTSAFSEPKRPYFAELKAAMKVRSDCLIKAASVQTDKESRAIILETASLGETIEQNLFKDVDALEKAVTPCLPGESKLPADDCFGGRQNVLATTLNEKLLYVYGELVPHTFNDVVEKRGLKWAGLCRYPFPVTHEYYELCRWLPLEIGLYSLAESRGQPQTMHLDVWKKLCRDKFGGKSGRKEPKKK